MNGRRWQPCRSQFTNLSRFTFRHVQICHESEFGFGVRNFFAVTILFWRWCYASNVCFIHNGSIFVVDFYVENALQFSKPSIKFQNVNFCKRQPINHMIEYGKKNDDKKKNLKIYLTIWANQWMWTASSATKKNIFCIWQHFSCKMHKIVDFRAINERK